MKKKNKSKKDKYFINRKIKRPKNNSKEVNANEKSLNIINSKNKTPLKNDIANALILKEKLSIMHYELLQEKDINYFVEFKTKPENIKIEKALINDVNHKSDCYSENIFIIFKSFNEINYIIYINESNSIVSYDIFNNNNM